MNKEKTNRLNGKDLINIGIFTAVYFILNLLIAAAMGFIPIVNMMIPFVSSLVLGIPMMLYFSKIKKFGMVLILLLFRVRFQVPASTGRILVMLRLRQPQVQVGSSLVGILPVQHIWQVIHRFQIHSLGLFI